MHLVSMTHNTYVTHNWHTHSIHEGVLRQLVMVVTHLLLYVIFNLQSQLPRVGRVQSSHTQVSVGGLETCNRYWVTATVVNSCGIRRSGPSSPRLVELHDVKEFELRVTLSSKPCSTWITEDADTKTDDLVERVKLAGSTCGIVIPCIVSSRWQCSDDVPEARFLYVYVHTNVYRVKFYTVCLKCVGILINMAHDDVMGCPVTVICIVMETAV